jgi:hypoxanthine phosphoribosyltransferase
MIITDEDKLELNNVKLFSMKYYKKGEEKAPYYSVVIPKEIGEKLVGKKVLVITEIE